MALDGKRVRGSYGNGKSAIHMVGAFAAETGLALAQVKTSDKSNEITAIPELLNALILKGCIVTLDAMGCQKEIVKKIVAKGGDYVISLKGNQGTLHEDVKLFLETERDNEFKKTAHDYYETVEKGHGRIETRRYWITDKIAWLDNKDNWEGLKSIGLVESRRNINGEESCELRCFISSLKPDANKFAQAVRQHWSIENNLHWQLDVTFDEDKLRMRVKNAAQNLAILRRMVLNTIKLDIHPGEILLEEFLIPLNISQNRLARDIHVAPRRINQIVHGERAITADTDLRLSKALGTSEGFWLGLQADYDLEEKKGEIHKQLGTIHNIFDKAA